MTYDGKSKTRKEKPASKARFKSSIPYWQISTSPRRPNTASLIRHKILSRHYWSSAVLPKRYFYAPGARVNSSYAARDFRDREVNLLTRKTSDPRHAVSSLAANSRHAICEGERACIRMRLQEEFEMAQDKIAIEAVNAVTALLHRMPDDLSRADALNVLMMTNYNLLRDVEGDAFVRAWLQAALQDLEHNPPVLALRETDSDPLRDAH